MQMFRSNSLVERCFDANCNQSRATGYRSFLPEFYAIRLSLSLFLARSINRQPYGTWIRRSNPWKRLVIQFAVQCKVLDLVQQRRRSKTPSGINKMAVVVLKMAAANQQHNVPMRVWIWRKLQLNNCER